MPSGASSLYHVYWFYKNWAIQKKAGYKDCWPIMRAIFSIFFAHALFESIDEKLKEKGETFRGAPRTIATIYVVFTLIENVCDRLSSNDIGLPLTYIVGPLVIPIIGWALYRAQLSANAASGDYAGITNSRLTPLNYLWIVLGSLLWLLTILGFFAVSLGLGDSAG